MQKQSYGDYEAPRIAAPTRGGRKRRRAKRAGAPPGEGATEVADSALGEQARTAVIVVHGMGQQLTFQTLDEVVNGLQNEHKAQLEAAGLPPTGAEAEVGILHPDVGGADDRLVPRATMALTQTESSDDPVRVDFYECYWAPMTQGAIGIRAVMGFLLDAGWNGLRNAGKQLTQTMFRREVELQRETLTAVWLWLALLCVGGLLLINGLTALVAAVRLFSESTPDWLSEPLINSLTWTLVFTLGFMALSLVLMAVLRKMLFFYAACLGLILGSLALVYLLAAFKFDWPRPEQLYTTWSWFVLAVWGALLIVSWFVRGLLVQYVGDVAVYVQPHKLGMFGKLRAAIKAEARAIARVVYSARDGEGRLQYDRVLIVGHSLGSVVAYDMLNDQMVRDLADGVPHDVITRTRLLLTFGSPLDKITFLFRSQGRAGAKTRERLAAARQPLILDYENRKHMRWVNIWSRKDIVSGALDYFDDKEDTQYLQAHVDNKEDPECRIPLKAHVEYWQNRLVFKTLYEALVTDVPAAPEAAAAAV